MKHAVEFAIATALRATLPAASLNANLTEVAASTRTAVGTAEPLIAVNVPVVVSNEPSSAVTTGSGSGTSTRCAPRSPPGTAPSAGRR